jgi:hypothetical protein
LIPDLSGKRTALTMKAVDSLETSGIENLASRRRCSEDLNVAEDPNTAKHCPTCLYVLLLRVVVFCLCTRHVRKPTTSQVSETKIEST